MSFDLRITFMGLCLFTPDDADPAKPRMHVLMPLLDGADGHPQHLLRLVYDEAYEARGAVQLSRRLVCVPLERKALIVGAPQTGASLALPDELADVDTVIGSAMIPRDLVTAEDPAASLGSRITLTSGAVTEYEAGAPFRFPGRVAQPMTFQLTWTIRGIEESGLTWGLHALGTPASQAEPLKTLYPIGGVVNIFVFNVVCAELPPIQPRTFGLPERAEHFGGYFRLAAPNVAAGNLPVPELRPLAEVGSVIRGDCGCRAEPEEGGVAAAHGHEDEDGGEAPAGPDPHAESVHALRARRRRGAAPAPVDRVEEHDHGDEPAGRDPGGIGGRTLVCILGKATLAE